MRLSRFRTTTRLYGAFGILIVVGVVMSAFFVWQLTRVGDQVGRLAAAADDNARTFQVGELIQSLRHLGLKYKTDGDEGVAAQFVANENRALDLLKTCAQLSPSDERRSLYAEAAGVLSEAGRNFDKLSQLVQQIGSERANLGTVIHRIDAAINALTAAAHGHGETTVDVTVSDVKAVALTVEIAGIGFAAHADGEGFAAVNAALEQATVTIDAY